MREILFRGKQLDVGEWVEGYYLSDCARHAIAVSHSLVQGWELHEVDPATVGQFTGLHDKSGKEIYEGDIVEWFDGKCTRRCVVEYNSRVAMFRLCGLSNYNPNIHKTGSSLGLTHKFREELSYGHTYSIIGNIHDNPELLGGAE